MKQSYKEEELLAAALMLPVPERAGYLARACGEAADLLSRVRSLLDASDDAAECVDSIAQDRVTTIGAYRITKELGAGGCSIAYLAEQAAPVKRQVALKIIKPGMDTKAVIARFEAERQALAMMDHPNVAKVFDAGATSARRPYFVMELVRGIKITDYCNQSRLSVRERLSLFIQVCQAIQHAHLKGIIHRDVKPSNVLVTMHDGAPIAKVIDFGIAKAIQGRLTDSTLHTALEQFIGTPAYASPEQTDPGSIDIDTRCDIYALGALLYELLTGYAPLDVSGAVPSGLDRVRELVREKDPVLPSQLPSVLAAEIHVDLDWIAMRCLEKERERRYQTVNELILDVQRYMNHEPVLARPPALAYILRKFVRRRRVMFATSLAGIAFVLFIIALALIASMQAQRIAAERERAEQEGARAQAVSEFMLQIFDAGRTSSGSEVSAREVLDEAARRIRDDFRQHPEVRAQLLEAIGRAYRRLQLYEKAVPHLEDALRIRRELADPTGIKTGSVVINLSISLISLGELSRAKELVKQALALARERKSEQTVTYGKLLLNLARVHLRSGDVANARDNLEESLRLLRQLLGTDHPEVADVHMQLTIVLVWQDDFAAAERAVREAARIFSATRAPLHPERVGAEAQLAYVLVLQNRANEATPMLERSLVALTHLYGIDSSEVAAVLDSMARAKRAQGQLEEAEDFARRALRAHEATLESRHIGMDNYRTNLALLLVWRGKHGEAEKLTRQALAGFAEALPPDHQYVASAEYVLGEALLAAGRAAEAERVLRESMHRWERSDAPRWRVARSQSALGEALERLGRIGEAERHLIESYKALAPDHRADREARMEAAKRVRSFYSRRSGERQADNDVIAAIGSASSP